MKIYIYIYTWVITESLEKGAKADGCLSPKHHISRRNLPKHLQKQVRKNIYINISKECKQASNFYFFYLHEEKGVAGNKPWVPSQAEHKLQIPIRVPGVKNIFKKNIQENN